MSDISRHLDEMRRWNRRPGTIEQRRRVLLRFEAFLNPRELLAATHDDLKAWVFDERCLAPESQASEISHLHQFYQWALLEGLIVLDPMTRIRRPRLPRRLPRPMETEDLDRAIEMASIRVKPWLLLAAYAGLRCAEIAQMRAEDVWWRAEPPLIIIRQSKGGSHTSVPMSPWLAAELRKCDLPSRGWLFRYRDGRRGPVPPWLVSCIGNAHLRSVGVNATMHQARHWFGTETLRASGGNLRVTQEALRHVSITSTQRYTFVQATEVAAAVAELPHPDAA